MKKIFAIASLALLTSVVLAHDKTFGENPDMYGSPLLDHDTAERDQAVQMGMGDNYASQLIPQPADHTHKAEPAVYSVNDPDGNQDILPN
ncbi:MAG: urea transporter [Candidatus Thiodiazotropha sp. (ex Dulcina madagascariensis)]|nr:urea transporter [Candidatus Thiodiazotropha sp. (ex Dulcina madagascariensis)]